MAEALRTPGRRLARLAERLGARLAALPRRWRLTAVVLLAAVQLAVPVRWILGFERTLAEGRPFRFRAAPVDPADPLRGRYVVLGFEAARAVPVEEGVELGWGETVWVEVVEGPDGFARLRSPSPQRPPEGDVLQARAAGVVGPGRGRGERTVSLRLPFDRFYLEEGAAPAAEALLREAVPAGEEAGDAVDEAPEVWAEVRLRDGQAVLADVLVDGVPLRDAVDAAP